MDLSGSDLSGNLARFSVPSDDIMPAPKPHPVDEFAMDFYRIHDKMRIEFGDLISLKFQKDREPKPKEKEVLAQLLKLRCDDFSEKVKAFWCDLTIFLQNM